MIMIGPGATSAEIETIYRERFRAFVLTATAILSDPDDALDAVQDAFASALKQRRHFRRDGRLEAWIWRIVLNVARDHLRSRGRNARPISVKDAALENSAPGADTYEVLLALPERQRLAVFLRYYADLSYADIAKALQVKPGTVAASLNSARRTMRGNLEEVQT